MGDCTALLQNSLTHLIQNLYDFTEKNINVVICSSKLFGRLYSICICNCYEKINLNSEFAYFNCTLKFKS